MADDFGIKRYPKVTEADNYGVQIVAAPMCSKMRIFIEKIVHVILIGIHGFDIPSLIQQSDEFSI